MAHGSGAACRHSRAKARLRLSASLSAILLLASIAPGSVFAQGGQGGVGNGGAGAGGADNPVAAGGAGGNATAQGGGGGGGAGTSGGAGGLNASADPVLGRGGAGGAHGVVGAGVPAGAATGSGGGAGGNGDATSAGGGGGAGGFGAVVTGTGALGSLAQPVTGGAGGAGGLGGAFQGGFGGSGGTGLFIVDPTGPTQLTIDTAVTGGVGGAGGGGASAGGHGAGGSGVVGANLAITIGPGGTVSGGLGGDGVTRADAITFLAGDNGLRFTGPTANLTGAIAIVDSAATLTIDQTTDITLANAITGAGSLAKSGVGRLVLTGTSAIGGGLSASAGALVLRGGSFAAGISGTIEVQGGSLTVEQGATLTNGTGQLVVINGSTLITGAGSRAIVGSALVQGAGAGGAGSLTIADGGVVESGSASVFGFFGGTAEVLITGAGSRWDLCNCATLSIGLGSGFAGSVTVADGATLTVSEIQIAEGSRLNIGNGGLAGTIETPLISSSGLIVADFSGTGTLAANIEPLFFEGGGGALTKRGPGVLTLSGANTYTGPTTLEGGVLSVAADNNLGALASTLALNGGVLRVTGTGFAQSLRPISFGPAGGGFDIASAGHVFTLTQSFSGTGSFSKAGEGTLLLAGAHSYSGATNVSGGVLRAGVAGAFSPNSAFVVAAGATLALNGFDQSLGSLAGAGAVELGSATLTTGGNGGTTAFGGAITGTGGLVKTGAGTFLLDGANSYSGGTTISGGALSGNSVSLQGAILNNAALIFDQASAGTYAGALSGSGTLTKRGAGALTLTGTSPFTGPTSVEAGLLVVNGSLAGSVVTLNGGALAGTGTVAGVNAASGMVAPGNSIGTLTVVGNVAFGPGSIFQVEVDAAGAGDRIVATGSALITGGLVQVLAAQGDYAPTSRYTILTAQGGVSGQFASLTTNLAFLTPTLSYGANDVVLTLARNDVSFAPGPSARFVAATRNQAGVARAAEALGQGNRVHDALLSSTIAEAQAGFDALSGEGHAQSVALAIETSELVRNALLERMRAPLGGGVAGTVLGGFSADLPGRRDGVTLPAPRFDARRFAVWGVAIGASGRSDSDRNAASYERRGGGLLFGAELDSAAGDAPWRVGVAAGFTRMNLDLDARRSDGTQDSIHAALYGAARFGAVNLRAGAAYAWNETELSRFVAIRGFSDALRHDGRGSTAQAFTEAGYGLTFGAVALEPFAQLAVISVRNEGGVERGGPAALRLSGRDQTLGFSTLGLRAEMQIAALPLFARGMLGWRHAFGEITPTAELAFASGGGRYRVYARPILRDALVAEAGLSWRLAGSASLGVAYGATLGEGSRDHVVRGRLDVSF
jgi:outer membrane autotransporter protein